MPDSKYCYPNTNILKNKLNIQNSEDLFDAEKELTLLRLQELQNNPIQGKFDFQHLKEIHQYIFQDIYEWAGEIRTVEIGKGNLFCTTACIDSYANSVFNNYYDYYDCDRDEIVEKYNEIYKEKTVELSQTISRTINNYSYDDIEL